MILVSAAALAFLGCGPGTPTGKTANVSAGAMPSDGDWSGVYYSPLFGNLHMEASGNSVEGRWLRPEKGNWGKLHGTADGNLLRFDWTEYDDGVAGPMSQKEGKGYFVYLRPEGDNVDDEIKGEIGMGYDEVGTNWHAIKQRNVKPNLKSIGGSGASEIGGGEWDRPNNDSGEPEDPVAPEPEPDAEPPEL
jgi:hypothetical protein